MNWVDQKYARTRSELESKLMGGKAQIVQSRDTLIEKRKQVRQEAESVARKLAQARADMKVYT